ncbi:MAG: L-ribulose-5-phosphate 4-epimerase AraD, partial [Opitutaceae bacterium]
SGVEYEKLSAEDMVVVDLDGNVVEGKYKPSSDTATHIELYTAFPTIGGVTHTHSHWATVFAQAGKGALPYGTTHADYFDGEIPCTRQMTNEEIAAEYKKNTGLVIIERFKNIDYSRMPVVLVHSHGSFSWGENAVHSVENSVILENVASLAFHKTMLKNNDPLKPMQEELLRKHFDRKHGPNAYYGQ